MWIATGEQSTVTSMKQFMISIIFTNDDIGKVHNEREMMNFCAWRKWFSQYLFGHKDVCKYSSIVISWMIWHIDYFISVEVKQLLFGNSSMMANDESFGFSLFIPFLRHSFWRNIGFLSASTVAKSFFDHGFSPQKRSQFRSWYEKWLLSGSPATPGFNDKGKKIPLSHTKLHYTLMRNYCQVSGIIQG
jgi:hypothetical protein